MEIVPTTVNQTYFFRFPIMLNVFFSFRLVAISPQFNLQANRVGSFKDLEGQNSVSIAPDGHAARGSLYGSMVHELDSS